MVVFVVSIFFLLGFHLVQSCLYSGLDDLVSYSLRPWPRITENDLNSVSCKSFIRFQYIDNEWYVIEDPRQILFSRNAAMKMFLVALQQFFSSEIPNGLDFIVDTSDGNYNSGPVMAYCRELNKTAIMVPDYGFFSWPESGQNGSYLSVYNSLLHVASLGKAWKIQEEQEKRKLFFVGNLFDRRKQLLEGTDYSKYLEIHEHKFFGMEAVREVPKGRSSFISLYDICKHPFLLHLPGGESYSSRLRYLLLCNSTVIWLDRFVKDQNGIEKPLYEEWFYPALIPYTHYLPAHNGMEINAYMKKFQSPHDPHLHIVQKCATKGSKLAKELLAPTCITQFWLRMFKEYHKRMAWKVITPHNDAELLINRVILDIRNADVHRNDPKNSHKLLNFWPFN
jgi:hypothetical protein